MSKHHKWSWNITHDYQKYFRILHDPPGFIHDIRKISLFCPMMPVIQQERSGILRHTCKFDTYAPKLKPSASAPSIFVWMFVCLSDTVNDMLSQETYQDSRSCPSKVGHIWQTLPKVLSSVGHAKDVLHDGVQIASTSLPPFERNK